MAVTHPSPRGSAHRFDRIADFFALRSFFVVLLILGSTLAGYAQNLPALTGRVVDNANLIDAASEATLVEKLAGFEKKSSDQIVVATVNTLNGQDIESYANALFREWKLGYAGTNNGILLLVAKDDRKMRIEVGYGLEGTLTDLHSSLIINNVLVPAFRAGNFAGGITQATDDIISVLEGNPEELTDRFKRNEDSIGNDFEIDPVLVIFLVIWGTMFFGGFALAFLAPIFGKKLGPGRYRWLGMDWQFGGSSGSGSGGYSGGSGWSGGSSGGGWSSGGSSGGGFSGGGGSSGGGGASGSW
jgi:uncharacterized protein